MIKDVLLEPYVELKTETMTWGYKRDETNDQITIDALMLLRNMVLV